MNNQTQRERDDARFEAMMKVVKIASIGVAAAVILSCFALNKVDDLLICTVLYGVSAFVGMVSMLLIFGSISLWRAEKSRKNFFLYDKKTKTDMPISALSFEMIRNRLTEFMSIFKRRGKIYVGDLFADNPHIPEQFKTLFCYEILYELALEDGSLDADVFLSFGDECAEIFSKYLHENGDHELALSVSGFLRSYSEANNTENFKAFIKNKKEHIEKKMLGYAVDNIDKFN